MEARTIKSPGTGVTGNYESPHAGIGSQIQVLWKKQVVFLTSELSLQPLLLFPKVCCDGYMKILSHLNALGISPEHTM